VLVLGKRGEPPPIRERAGIQNLAFKGAGRFELRTDREDLADVARDSVQPAIRTRGESGYLRRRDVEKARVGVIGIEPVHVALVSSADDHAPLGVEYQRVDHV